VRGAISNGRPYRDNYPETGLEEINGDVLDADFGITSAPASGGSLFNNR
jgi:hypothetical protein